MYRGWNVVKYLQNLVVSMWQCETKYQNQNPVENQYQTVKRHTDQKMDRIGSPGVAWFLCLIYICFCLNNYVDPSLVMGQNLQLWWLVLLITTSVCCWISISGSHFTTSLIQQINHLVLNQKRELDGLVLMKILVLICVTSLSMIRVKRLSIDPSFLL